MSFQKIIIILMVIGIAAIAGTAISYQINSQSLTSGISKQPLQAAAQVAPQAQSTQQSIPSAPAITGMSMLAMGGENVNPAIAEQVGVAMMALQANPQDVNVIGDLTLLFYQAGDFEAMKSFLARANTINPDAPKIKILTYLSDNELHDPIEATQKLEQSLAAEKTPETLALLAYLYGHVLNEQEKAASYIEQARQLSGSDIAF